MFKEFLGDLYKGADFSMLNEAILQVTAGDSPSLFRYRVSHT